MIFYLPLQLNNVSLFFFLFFFFSFIFPLVQSSTFPPLFFLSSSNWPKSSVEAHPLPFIFSLSSSTLADPSPLPLTANLSNLPSAEPLDLPSRRPIKALCSVKVDSKTMPWSVMAGILGSSVLDCWVCGFPICIFFCWFFGSSLHWYFGVWFFFFCGFGCDCGLWLKWRFGGYVGGGLVGVVVVAMSCAGFGCNSGLWLWLCWWWFELLFFPCHGLWLPHGGCC